MFQFSLADLRATLSKSVHCFAPFSRLFHIYQRHTHKKATTETTSNKNTQDDVCERERAQRKYSLKKKKSESSMSKRNEKHKTR